MLSFFTLFIYHFASRYYLLAALTTLNYESMPSKCIVYHLEELVFHPCETALYNIRTSGSYLTETSSQTHHLYERDAIPSRVKLLLNNSHGWIRSSLINERIH